MSDKKYEGNISGYSFIMQNESTIEVWSDDAGEFPDGFIHVKTGSVKNEKDFHVEIFDWYSKNVAD